MTQPIDKPDGFLAHLVDSIKDGHRRAVNQTGIGQGHLIRMLLRGNIFGWATTASFQIISYIGNVGFAIIGRILGLAIGHSYYAVKEAASAKRAEADTGESIPSEQSQK